MAIEDAMVLGSCVARQTTIENAFGQFEALRRPRVAEAAKLTRRNSSQKRATNWFERLARRMIMPLVLPVGIKASRRLLTYRVDEQRIAA